VTEQPLHPARGEAAAQVRELAGRRLAARIARDFGAADQLRDEIAELGWVVTDTRDGYTLTPAGGSAAESGASEGGAPEGRAPEGRAPEGRAPEGRAPEGRAAGAPACGRTRRYKVLPTPAAIPLARPGPASAAGRVATVGLLVEGWPDDLRECVAALLEHAPAGVLITGLDVGNMDDAGEVLESLAAAHPDRVEALHVAGSPGWSAGRNALLRAGLAPVHVIMETSTILTGDAISPLLGALSADGVVAAGWRGADPDPDLMSFHKSGPGQVTALLGYLLAVRTEAAAAVGGLPARARFYRNADLEFSLRLGRLGKLVVPDQLPVRQTQHRGYHDSDPGYRERESRRNYRRVLDLLRSGDAPRGSRDDQPDG
jgi:hypothetical protein